MFLFLPLPHFKCKAKCLYNATFQSMSLRGQTEHCIFILTPKLLLMRWMYRTQNFTYQLTALSWVNRHLKLSRLSRRKQMQIRWGIRSNKIEKVRKELFHFHSFIYLLAIWYCYTKKNRIECEPWVLYFMNHFEDKFNSFNKKWRSLYA